MTFLWGFLGNSHGCPGAAPFPPPEPDPRNAARDPCHNCGIWKQTSPNSSLAVVVGYLRWRWSWFIEILFDEGWGVKRCCFSRNISGILEAFWLDASTPHDPVKLEPDSAPPECQSNPKAVQLLEQKPKTVGDIITIPDQCNFFSLYMSPRHLSGKKQHMLRFWLLRRYLKQQRVPRDLCFRAPRLPCNFSRRVVGNFKWLNCKTWWHFLPWFCFFGSFQHLFCFLIFHCCLIIRSKKGKMVSPHSGPFLCCNLLGAALHRICSQPKLAVLARGGCSIGICESVEIFWLVLSPWHPRCATVVSTPQ